MSVAGSVLGPENYSNLRLLIKKALQWVEARFDRLCEHITAQLEAEDYEDLLSRESIIYSKPTLADIDKARLGP